jgi:hypothetical protein
MVMIVGQFHFSVLIAHVARKYSVTIYLLLELLEKNEKVS